MNWTILDGDIYVSKNGNDTTGDGSMNNPYASINKATTIGITGNKIVIGTGVWKESRGTSTNAYNFYGDGEVIFNGSDIYKFNTNISNETFINFEFNNYKGSYFLNGILQSPAFNAYYNNCKFINVQTFITYNGSFTRPNLFLKNCILINFLDSFTSYHGFTWYFENCIIDNFESGTKNQQGAQISKCINTIIKNSNKLYIGNVYGEFDYNLILDNLWVYYTVGGFTYTDLAELKTRQTGSRYTNQNSIGLNPKFNNESIGDYTLKPDSPCLFAGKNNAHIGAYGLGYNFNANSTEFTEEGGAIFSQSDVGSGTENDIITVENEIKGVISKYFILNNGHTEGTVESAWIDFQSIYELNAVQLFANFIYDEDGIATGRLDIDNNDTGEFPNQYDFELKTSLTEDNKTSATWQEVIGNKSLDITARFVKLKIYFKE